MNDQQKVVPYFAYEAALAQNERTIKRLWILALVLIFLLVGSNIAWLAYESGFETYEITAEQDGHGVNIVGGGDVSYGSEGND